LEEFSLEDLMYCRVRATNEGIVIINSSDVILLLDRKAEELLGVKGEELVGTSLKRSLPQLTFAKHQQKSRLACPHGAVECSTHWLRWNEKMVARAIILRTLPDAALSEEGQEAEAIRLGIKMAIDVIDDCIMICNPQGEIIYLNKAAERLDGLKINEVIGQHITKLYDMDDETSIFLKSLKLGGKAIDNVYHSYVTKYGKHVRSVSSSYPININGELVAMLGHQRDVSRFQELYDKILDYQQQSLPANERRKKKKYPYYTFKDIVGASEEMQKSLHLARITARNSSPVLICGETGTGKELFSQSIHNADPLLERPFLAINCAAIPESLLEGILFGTVKGAFTGAVDRPGLLEQADGGTLFLDEVNSMGVGLQSKLLRALEEGRIRRVGGTAEVEFSCRIISSVNMDPIQAVIEGKLRQDLFYRLGVIIISVPPLRQRRSDIPLLVEHFLGDQKAPRVKVTRETMEALQQYSWPGNVRELKHALEFAVNFLGENGKILPEHLPEHIKSAVGYGERGGRNKLKSLEDQMASFEREVIIQTLEQTGGRITAAAKILGIKRQSLEYRLKKYNISIKPLKRQTDFA